MGTKVFEAMCEKGVAGEWYGIYDMQTKRIQPKLPNAKAAAKPFAIKIEDTKCCLRFTARVIRNVKIVESPAKILDRLAIDDHRGVSNSVAASNYTLMAFGKPPPSYYPHNLNHATPIVPRPPP